MCRFAIGPALLALGAGCYRPVPPRIPPVPVVPVSAMQMLNLLSDGTNAVTLLHVWATWCPPCVEEFPRLVALTKAYRDRGLRVLLLSADAEKDAGAVARFLAANHVDEQSYQAINLNDDFIKAVSTNWSGALPASFFYTPDGTLAAWWEGSRPLDTHEQTVLNLLKHRQPGG